MSTYSIPVSGPSAKLAMLRALAIKLGHATAARFADLRLTISRASTVVRATANLTLAALGSRTGYDLTTTGIRTLVTSTWNGIRWVFSRTSRLLGHGTRLIYRALATVSPSAAKLLEDTLERWIIEPTLNTALTIDRWVQAAGNLLWELSRTGIVRMVTVSAAQIAGIFLAIHAVTKGAAAAKLVTLLPWTMDAVIWLTNPMIAIGLVAASFAVAAGFAAFRVINSQPGQPSVIEDSETGDVVTNESESAGTAVTDLFAGIDLNAIAAQVRVEVTTDGSVIVHGIPQDIPPVVGERIATIAADAAVSRLVRILPNRTTLNRDDKRLITKVAREAVRKAA